jgi:hypothetical protein
MQHCQGSTKAGNPCKAAAGSGGLCFFHAHPEHAKALGQKGGRNNRRLPLDLHVPNNMSATDLRDVTVQAIRLLMSGHMHAREASALAQLCNSLQRTLPTADLETRIASLEKQVEHDGNGGSPDSNSSRCFMKGPEAPGSNTGSEVVEASSASTRDETPVWTQPGDATENATEDTSEGASSSSEG